jgi:hypothetical protein
MYIERTLAFIDEGRVGRRVKRAEARLSRGSISAKSQNREIADSLCNQSD